MNTKTKQRKREELSRQLEEIKRKNEEVENYLNQLKTTLISRVGEDFLNQIMIVLLKLIILFKVKILMVHIDL